MNYNYEIVKKLRKQFPVNCRIVLDKMDDPQAPPVGTAGTVLGVDDAGSILVKWDAGGSLNIVYGEDKCHRIYPVKAKDGKAIPLKHRCPPGCRIILDQGFFDIPAGTIGTVAAIPDNQLVYLRMDGKGYLTESYKALRFHRIHTQMVNEELAVRLLDLCNHAAYRADKICSKKWHPANAEQVYRMLNNAADITVVLNALNLYKRTPLPEKEAATVDKLLYELNIRYEAATPLLAKAKKLINAFVCSEYSEKGAYSADYTDLTRVGLAYTVSEQNKEIQAYADLVNNQMLTFLEDKLVSVSTYPNLEQFIEYELNYLDFDSLVEIPEWGEPNES